MTKFYSVLEGTQDDINRRLLRRITALENAQGNNPELEARVKALEDLDSDTRLTALEDLDIDDRLKELEGEPHE